MANNKTLLLLALGAGAVYLMTRQANPAAGLPAGAMNPNGFAYNPNNPDSWWQGPAGALLDRAIYYPFNASPGGSPTPQSATQMAWPTSAYA